MERRRYLTLAGTIFSTTLAGCIGSDSDGDSNPESTGDVSEETDFPVDDATHSFTGSEGAVTESFELDSGLTVIRANFPGDGNHRIDLVRPDGSSTGQHFVGRANEYHGEQATHIDGGEYILDVSTPTDWEIGIYQPNPDSGVTDLPNQVTGSDDTVIGPYRFTGEHRLTATTVEGRFMHARIYGSEEDGTVSLVSNVETSDETIFNFDGNGFVQASLAKRWELEFE